jgi:hypothetical protein
LFLANPAPQRCPIHLQESGRIRNGVSPHS